jgi:glycosyltransferase involved in cell wall biosynthesis
MKILYLLFNQQDSLMGSNKSPRISLSWVDALIDELVKCDSVEIALAVPLNDNTFQKGEKNGITLFGLPNPEEKNFIKKAYNRITNAYENANVNSYISQAIDEFKPDIIQIFGSENIFGLIAKEQSIPVIIHIQGYLLVWQGKWFTGISKWDQFRYAGIKDLLLMRGTYNSFFAFTKRAETEAIILENCKYFMGRTNFDKRIASLISPNSTYFHCEEFIRKMFFEKQWDFPLQDEIKCISIIRATSYKGVDLLYKVFLILEKYSGLSFKFRICGTSENDDIIKIIKKKYRKEIDHINIEYLGKLTPEVLVDELCNSNIYVHPSYIENSPNSVCEAMALGMPIIATNVGGVSDLIEDEVEGILVQEGEPYSFAGALVELTNNYEKAKQFGRNARTKAFKRHNPDDILKDILKIYKTIIYEDGREDLS